MMRKSKPIRGQNPFVFAATLLISYQLVFPAQAQQAEDQKGSARTPLVKAKNPAFEKFPEPRKIHEHYVNNLFDAAKKFYDTREDVPLKERADFYGLIGTLAATEKVSTDTRNTMIVERKAIPVFDGYLEKMGAEATKELIAKYIAVRIPKFTELVSVKKWGLEKELNDIVKGALNKAVDDVAAKKAKENDAVIGGQSKETNKTSEQGGSGNGG